MNRSAPIDRSPKLKVGARVQVKVGYRAGDRGKVETLSPNAFWVVEFDGDGARSPYLTQQLRLLSKPRTRVKKENKPRKLKTFEKNFGDGGKQGAWIRTFACCVPLCESQWRNVQASHITSQGAGGTRAQLAPMCDGHHVEWHGGRETFSAKYDTDFLAIAHRLSQIFDLNTHLALRLRAAAKSSEEAAGVIEGLHVQADPSFDLGGLVDKLEPLLKIAKVRFEPVDEERVTP